MAGRMPPSTSARDNPAAVAASSDAAIANYTRLQQWIQRECSECDAAIEEHRKQVADYRTQKGRLEELQKKISHPIMVPFGSVGFMPGKLVRTNEVMVLLGANYFAECSVHDTAKIIDRRIREINSLIDKLEHQKKNASERLNFAQGLFGGATGVKDDLVEIREDYDEEKEAEAKRKRAERAAAAREEKKVPQAAFESVMSHLDELEKQEKAVEKKGKPVRVVDSDDESEEEEEEEYVEQPVSAPPKGVTEEEYKRLLARLDELDNTSEDEVDSDDIIEEEEEPDVEVDSDDLSDSDEKQSRMLQLRRQREAEERRALIQRETREGLRAAVAPQPPRRPLIEVIEDEPATVTAASPAKSIAKQSPKMTVVSENDRVVDLVEYQNQQEEDDKAKENAPAGKSKLTHKRSVRFKKNLEAGPCEQQKSIDSVEDVLPSVDSQIPNPRSILRNKSEESPIDKIAFSEMEDQRSTTILPCGDAFSGCVVERSPQVPIVFKPVDEPPRRVSRFKLQRMQQCHASE